EVRRRGVGAGRLGDPRVRLGGGADGAVAAKRLEESLRRVAEREEAVPSGGLGGVEAREAERFVRLERRSLGRAARQRLPDFLGGERADRREEEREGLAEPHARGLRGAPDGIVGAADVERVLTHVAPEGREV